ncbi:MAG TPA: tripartite tricarboxylate transporter substrate-binding protein [Stellaceae bacterium]|nr:tripartite tricarboxylate transporter substrate-binding protein [Stellaceae bacterium]
MDRRDFLIGAGAIVPALAAPRLAHAVDAFPEKDITFIIPYSAGGGFDNYVRAIAPAMEKYLPHKVNVIPTNVAAGGGTRGTNQLYRAKPDGFTIAIFNIPGMFVLQERGGAEYDLAKVTWLGSIGRDHYGIGVGASSPLKSVADLKALSATRPVKFTTTGPEATAYAATLIATDLLGIKSQLIGGYKGSNDYVVAAIRGDGDAVITALPLLRRMQAGGELRILADFEPHSTVPGAADAASLGQPELAEIVLERLIGAPPGLPPDIAAVLSDALAKAVADPATVAWGKASDSELAWAPPERAARILAEQAAFFQKWKKYLAPG